MTSFRLSYGSQEGNNDLFPFVVWESRGEAMTSFRLLYGSQEGGNDLFPSVVWESRGEQ